jgi:hypothetical protein
MLRAQRTSIRSNLPLPASRSRQSQSTNRRARSQSQTLSSGCQASDWTADKRGHRREPQPGRLIRSRPLSIPPLSIPPLSRSRTCSPAWSTLDSWLGSWAARGERTRSSDRAPIVRPPTPLPTTGPEDSVITDEAGRGGQRPEKGGGRRSSDRSNACLYR